MKPDSSHPLSSASEKHTPPFARLQLPPHVLARKQALSSIAGQKVILEKIATGGSLKEILTLFCQMIEAQSSWYAVCHSSSEWYKITSHCCS